MTLTTLITTQRPEIQQYPDPARRLHSFLEDAQLTLSGRPIASFEILGLPSVNTHYSKHYKTRATHTKKWRTLACEMATQEYTAWESKPLIHRALVVVNVWVPHEGVMDIHNVHIKPVLDGFSDAGLWVDDEWAFVPIVIFRWAGVGAELLERKRGKKRRTRARRTVIDVYELQLFSISGQYQRLPKGRTWTIDTDWDRFMSGSVL